MAEPTNRPIRRPSPGDRDRPMPGMVTNSRPRSIKPESSPTMKSTSSSSMSQSQPPSKSTSVPSRMMGTPEASTPKPRPSPSRRPTPGDITISSPSASTPKSASPFRGGGPRTRRRPPSPGMGMIGRRPPSPGMGQMKSPGPPTPGRASPAPPSPGIGRVMTRTRSVSFEDEVLAQAQEQKQEQEQEQGQEQGQELSTAQQDEEEQPKEEQKQEQKEQPKPVSGDAPSPLPQKRFVFTKKATGFTPSRINVSSRAEPSDSKVNDFAPVTDAQVKQNIQAKNKPEVSEVRQVDESVEEIRTSISNTEDNAADDSNDVGNNGVTKLSSIKTSTASDVEDEWEPKNTSDENGDHEEAPVKSSIKKVILRPKSLSPTRKRDNPLRNNPQFFKKMVEAAESESEDEELEIVNSKVEKKNTASKLRKLRGMEKMKKIAAISSTKDLTIIQKNSSQEEAASIVADYSSDVSDVEGPVQFVDGPKPPAVQSETLIQQSGSEEMKSVESDESSQVSDQQKRRNKASRYAGMLKKRELVSSTKSMASARKEKQSQSSVKSAEALPGGPNENAAEEKRPSQDVNASITSPSSSSSSSKEPKVPSTPLSSKFEKAKALSTPSSKNINTPKKSPPMRKELPDIESNVSGESAVSAVSSVSEVSMSTKRKLTIAERLEKKLTKEELRQQNADSSRKLSGTKGSPSFQSRREMLNRVKGRISRSPSPSPLLKKHQSTPSPKKAPSTRKMSVMKKMLEARERKSEKSLATKSASPKTNVESKRAHSGNSKSKLTSPSKRIPSLSSAPSDELRSASTDSSASDHLSVNTGVTLLREQTLAMQKLRSSPTPKNKLSSKISIHSPGTLSANVARLQVLKKSQRLREEKRDNDEIEVSLQEQPKVSNGRISDKKHIDEREADTDDGLTFDDIEGEDDFSIDDFPGISPVSASLKSPPAKNKRRTTRQFDTIDEKSTESNLSNWARVMEQRLKNGTDYEPGNSQSDDYEFDNDNWSNDTNDKDQVEGSHVQPLAPQRSKISNGARSVGVENSNISDNDIGMKSKSFINLARPREETLEENLEGNIFIGAYEELLPRSTNPLLMRICGPTKPSSLVTPITHALPASDFNYEQTQHDNENAPIDELRSYQEDETQHFSPVMLSERSHRAVEAISATVPSTNETEEKKAQEESVRFTSLSSSSSNDIYLPPSRDIVEESEVGPKTASHNDDKNLAVSFESASHNDDKNLAVSYEIASHNDDKSLAKDSVVPSTLIGENLAVSYEDDDEDEDEDESVENLFVNGNSNSDSLLGPSHVNSFVNGNSRSNSKSGSLIGPAHVESADGADEENNISHDNSNSESVAEWWQNSYAHTQDDDVNSDIKQALSQTNDSISGKDIDVRAEYESDEDVFFGLDVSPDKDKDVIPTAKPQLMKPVKRGELETIMSEDSSDFDEIMNDDGRDSPPTKKKSKGRAGYKKMTPPPPPPPASTPPNRLLSTRNGRSKARTDVPVSQIALGGSNNSDAAQDITPQTGQKTRGKHNSPNKTPPTQKKNNLTKHREHPAESSNDEGSNRSYEDDESSHSSRSSGSDGSYTFGSATMQSMDLNERERRKWSDWDKKDHDSVFTGMSNFDSEYSMDSKRRDAIMERRASAHEKLLMHAYTALSKPPPRTTIEKGSSSHHQLPHLPASGSSQYQSDAENQSPGVDQPPKQSYNKRRQVLEKFCVTIKHTPLEVLKLNREKKWQSRFLTVSKEGTWLKNTSSSSKANSCFCPLALLWLKKQSRNSDHSVTNIDRQGKGGMIFSHMFNVKIEPELAKAYPLTKKQNEKFKNSVVVRLFAENAGNSSVVIFRCSQEVAETIMMGCSAIIDVLKGRTKKEAKPSKRGADGSSSQQYVARHQQSSGQVHAGGNQMLGAPNPSNQDNGHFPSQQVVAKNYAQSGAPHLWEA